MTKKVFSYETVLESPLTEVWDFFQSIDNVTRITSFPKVTVVSSTPEAFVLEFDGIINKWKWYGEIVKSEEKVCFIDVNVKPPFPFKSWRHTHTFEQKDNATKMKDTVEYESAIPSFLINVLLQKMFKDREKGLCAFFTIARMN